MLCWIYVYCHVLDWAYQFSLVNICYNFHAVFLRHWHLQWFISTSFNVILQEFQLTFRWEQEKRRCIKLENLSWFARPQKQILKHDIKFYLYCPYNLMILKPTLWFHYQFRWQKIRLAQVNGCFSLHEFNICSKRCWTLLQCNY